MAHTNSHQTARRVLAQELLDSETSDEETNPPPPRTAGTAPKSTRFKRHGGFRPVPRKGNLDAPVRQMDQWRHNATEDSLWWGLLEHTEAYDQGSYWYKEFIRQFGVPREVYDQYYAELKDLPEFADKVAGGPGSGYKGPPSQSLRLKAIWSLNCRLDDDKGTR